MTDEEVIREALKIVTDYANRHPGDQFNINNCIDHALASVKDIWKKARHYSSYQALKWEDQDEITRLIRRIATDLRARAYIKASECLKNRKIQQINMATAESLITYELRQRGFMFSFIWQKLRVKVSIKLECGSAMTFIVKYKDIREGKLLQILDEVMAVVEASQQNKNQHISMAPIRGLEDMERMESIDFKAITAEVATKISNMSLKERTGGWHRSFETRIHVSPDTVKSALLFGVWEKCFELLNEQEKKDEPLAVEKALTIMTRKGIPKDNIRFRKNSFRVQLENAQYRIYR